MGSTNDPIKGGFLHGLMVCLHSVYIYCMPFRVLGPRNTEVNMGTALSNEIQKKPPCGIDVNVDYLEAGRRVES